MQLGLIFGCLLFVLSHMASAEIEAACDFDTNEGTVTGSVFMYQDSANSELNFFGALSGIEPDGLHGFHIHAVGDTSEKCVAAGPHFNPFNLAHGGPKDEMRHVGDLGNIEVQFGIAIIEMNSTLPTLFEGETNVIGRAIVVHSGEDDLGESGDPSGNSGTRIGCCVIYEINKEK